MVCLSAFRIEVKGIGNLRLPGEYRRKEKSK
jgi:hypothetical protein